MDGWKMSFLLGPGLFSGGYISVREGKALCFYHGWHGWWKETNPYHTFALFDPCNKWLFSWPRYHPISIGIHTDRTIYPQVILLCFCWVVLYPMIQGCYTKVIAGSDQETHDLVNQQGNLSSECLGNSYLLRWNTSKWSGGPLISTESWRFSSQDCCGFHPDL